MSANVKIACACGASVEGPVEVTIAWNKAHDTTCPLMRATPASDQTPALARATEAVSAPIPDINRLSHAEIRQWLAHAAVSAALHDPDDDVIARTLTVHSRWTDGEAVRWIDGANRGELVYMCSCGRVLPVDVPSTRAKVTAAHAVHQADAVRAAILGEVA